MELDIGIEFWLSGTEIKPSYQLESVREMKKKEKRLRAECIGGENNRVVMENGNEEIKNRGVLNKLVFRKANHKTVIFSYQQAIYYKHCFIC